MSDGRHWYEYFDDIIDNRVRKCMRTKIINIKTRTLELIYDDESRADGMAQRFNNR